MFRTVFILFFTLISSLFVLGNELINVKKITYQEGLSENTISSINQDSLGYIWIGTREGLNRYNGYSCKNYFASFDNSGGLSSSSIQKIFIDTYSQMWISTAKGVDCYLPETDSFRKLEIEINKQIINRVNDVCEQSGIKWLATSGFGLVGIEPQTEIVQYHSDFNESFSLICPKNESELWLTSGNKLELFNSKSKNFGQSILAPFKENIIGLKYYSGLLWLNTRDGLWIYNELESEFTLFKDYIGKQGDEIDEQVARLNDVLITHLVVQNEKLWISTDGKGIFILDLKDDFHIDNITISSSGNSLATNYEIQGATKIVDGLNFELSSKDKKMTDNVQESLLFGDKPIKDYAFCTEEEQGPFIKIDLGGTKEIHGVVIYNRKLSHHDRAKNLTIWISNDGQNWTKYWSAESIKESWDIPFTTTSMGATISGKNLFFIKIGIDSNQETVLHLNQIEIYGK